VHIGKVVNMRCVRGCLRLPTAVGLQTLHARFVLDRCSIGQLKTSGASGDTGDDERSLPLDFQLSAGGVGIVRRTVVPENHICGIGLEREIGSIWVLENVSISMEQSCLSCSTSWRSDGRVIGWCPLSVGFRRGLRGQYSWLVV
jgi:hypothetical protein